MININWSKHTRLELLSYLVKTKSYKKYLEIGCDKNQVFDNIIVDLKEGVDPIRGGTIRKTSDDFFSSDTRKWDLIFIDGLHEYHQVKRDVENSLDRLEINGTIVIHDMLPMNETEAAPSPISKAWMGDVWRLSFDLMSRSDIKFNIFNFDCGCGIITKLPQNPVHFEKVDNTWEFYVTNFSSLPIVTFDQYFKNNG